MCSIPAFRRAFATTVLLLSAATHADAIQAQSPDSSGFKSPSMALGLSLHGTALPVVAGLCADQPWLVVSGLVVGPAIGHFYADEPQAAVGGILFRVLVPVGMAFVGAGAAQGEDEKFARLGTVLVFASLGVAAGTARLVG
jgi:hypothetical protein